MDPSRAFADLMERNEAEIDLARAALLFAALEYPDLDVEGYLARLEHLAADLQPRISPEESPPRVIAILGGYLVGEQRFRGNREEYYDPRNSYLNEVLDRRLGIPISLSVVWLEVGRRVGFSLDGVGMPGHFLLRYPDPVSPLLIDPFDDGAVLSEEDLARRLRGMYGETVSLSSDMLRPVGAKTILFRMLNNLKGIYVRREDTPRAVRTVDLMLLVEPGEVTGYRDRGLLHFRAGDLKRARADLQHYLELRPQGPDSRGVRARVDLIDRLEVMRN